MQASEMTPLREDSRVHSEENANKIPELKSHLMKAGYTRPNVKREREREEREMRERERERESLHLFRGVETSNPTSILGYDTKQSDDKLQILELKEMWTTPSLSLLPAPLSPGVVVLVRFSSLGQIELFNHLIAIITIS